MNSCESCDSTGAVNNGAECPECQGGARLDGSYRLLVEAIAMAKYLDGMSVRLGQQGYEQLDRLKFALTLVQGDNEHDYQIRERMIEGQLVRFFRCPGCGSWKQINQDQYLGRQSIQCDQLSGFGVCVFDRHVTLYECGTAVP